MENDIFNFWTPFLVALISLGVNIVQLVGYRRVRNKITVWAKDAKGMITSIVGLQDNIKKKKVSKLSAVSSNLDTLANFANSMFVSMEEELGHTKREIKLPKRKAPKEDDEEKKSSKKSKKKRKKKSKK